MQEPATAPWGLSISDADLKKLKAGFEPEDQDDKWLVSVKDDQSGTTSTHVVRAGTGKEYYVLHTKPSSGSGSSSSGGKVEAITWEQNKNGIHISEEQAKKEVVLITRSVLECGFEALPEYDTEDVFNYPAS